MRSLKEILQNNSQTQIRILDTTIPIHKYTPINLSVTNKALVDKDISDPYICQAYIDKVLQLHKATVAYGGYLEKRQLYTTNSNFSKTKRDIHLGIDFWAAAGTKVLVPITGIVHSFKNNATLGDYGPTIILKHSIEGVSFFTLYGHLSIDSLKGLYIGKEFLQGETLATLGEIAINVNYAPHLHFQIIKDITGYVGDYPGVCAIKDLEYYNSNCPNPNYLLKI